jgi:NADH-quinone oxidoreductase subunit L
MNPESLVFSNLLIYLLGFLFLLSLNNTVFVKTSSWISLVINLLGVIVTSNIVLNYSGTALLEYDWISIDKAPLTFSILFDAQAKFMLLLVQVIGCFVNLFSSKYMVDDPGSNRFFAYLNLFIFSMLGLTLAGSLFQLYFFWELVGFCSYLLIGFWYTKKSANSAAIKAFLINRIGDAFFLGGIFMIYYLYGTLNFAELSTAKLLDREYILLSSHQLQTLAVLLLFGGVMAKSAQLPFQVWLPDAMEGPTPASALIHAATMVVAGVFLLGRIIPIITPDAGLFIAIVGALTSLFAAISALFQHDIKKVLAFSTISQLGFMVAGMGMGHLAASLFHLTTHAFFKAGLFLCAGTVISHLHHEQDMRKMGNLIHKIPAVFTAFVICSAALVGLPFTSGFLSKESILNASFIYGLEDPGIKTAVPIFLIIATFITTCYVIRQVVMVFFQREDSPIEVIIDSTKKTVGGAIKSFQDILTGDNKGDFEERTILFIRNLGVYDLVTLALGISSLWFFYSSNPFHNSEVWFFKEFGGEQPMYDWLPWLVGFLFLSALLVSYNSTLEEIRKYYFQEPEPRWKQKLEVLAIQQFNMDKLYENGFRKFFLGNSGILASVDYIEKYWMDGWVKKISKSTFRLAKLSSIVEARIIDASVLGIFSFLKNIGNKIRKWGDGNIQLYLTGLVLVLAAIVLILIVL